MFKKMRRQEKEISRNEAVHIKNKSNKNRDWAYHRKSKEIAEI